MCRLLAQMHKKHDVEKKTSKENNALKTTTKKTFFGKKRNNRKKANLLWKTGPVRWGKDNAKYEI